MTRKKKIFWSAVALKLVLLIGAYALLHTSSGFTWLARGASRLASNADTKVVIEDLSGTLPHDLKIGRITIADKQGVWLEIVQAHLDWHPLAALRGKWRVDALEAETIRIDRLPQAEEEKQASSFVMPKIPDLSLQKLHIGEIDISANITGARQRLTASGGGTAENYTLHVVTLEGANTSLTIDMQTPGGKPRGTLMLDEKAGGVTGRLLKLPPDAALHVAAEAETDEQDRIRFENVIAQAGRTFVYGSGLFDASAQEFLFSGTLEAPQLKEWSGLAGVAVNGNIKTAFEVKHAADTLHFTIDGAGIVNGEAVALKASGAEHQQRLTLTVDNALFRKYAAHGVLEADMERAILLSSFIKLEPLALSTLMHSPPFAGTAQAEIRAKGDVKTLNIEALASILSDAGAAMSEIKFDGNFTMASKQLEGKINGWAIQEKEKFTLETGVLATEESIVLQQAKLQGPGVMMKGDTALHTASALVDSRLELHADDLRPLGALLGQTLSGSAEGNVLLSSANNTQMADVVLSAKALRVGDTEVHRLEVRAKGDLHEKISVEANANGTAADAPFSMAATLEASGSAQQDAALMLRLKTLRGEMRSVPFVLNSPALLTLRDEQITLDRFSLNAMEGQLTAEGIYAPAKVDMRLNARGIALRSLPAEGMPDGKINASLALKGTPAAPVAALKADGQISAAAYPLNISGNAEWKAGKLSATASVSNPRGDVNANAKVVLSAPFSLSPFVMDISEHTPLRGDTSAHATLDALNPYIRANGHRAGGQLNGSGTITGTVGHPDITGKYMLANGSYDHVESGICLRNVSATLEGSQQKISLSALQATDVNGRRLSGEGALQLQDAKTLAGALTFQDFRLFCGGLATGNIGGNVKAAGTLEQINITGDLMLSKLNIQLPGNHSGKEIPEIKTVKLDPKTGKPKQKKEETESGGNSVSLNVSVNAPEQIFVRGRGLDAEFGGKMAIQGTAASPQFEGDFQSVRGKFELLGHQLRLSKAALHFDGPIPPSPFLDVVAETSAQDADITVTLSGTARSPELTLSSEPALPQDEILAQLLFGRRLATITPFQAAQLAQSARELAGYSSGPGVLDRVRGLFGVDTLDVDTGENNDVSVGAGKYVTDRVYVGVKQGATPESRAVTTEIELSPSISANTSVDADANQSVGVQWKYDY